MINPAWVLKGKLLVGGIAAAFIIGTVSGGVVVRKIMDGTIARKQLKAEKQRILEYEAALVVADNTITKERGLREIAEQGTERLTAQLTQSDNRYAKLLDDTNRALLRVPKDTIRIINQGEKIGDKIIDENSNNKWIRYVWDDRMYDHAFCIGQLRTENAEVCGLRVAKPVSVSVNP